MEEIWKDIPNYEGLYQISNFGNIKSMKFRNGKCCYKRERKLNTKTTGNYNHIVLFKNGKRKNHLIHRLVAEAFIPNPNNYKEVNHKDENSRNNNVENLEWCEHKYNINYGSRTKKVIDKMSKSVNQYDLEHNYVKTWFTMNDAIRFYNNRHIVDVCKGKRKTAGGYIWEYRYE